MKLLFVSSNYYPEMGGVGTVVQSICENLATLGHTCTILAENPYHTKQYEYLNNIEIIRVNRSNKLLFGLNYSAWRLIHNNLFANYDIIHIHGYHTLLSLECAYAFNEREQPIIFSPHYHGVGHTKFSDFLLNVYRPIGKNLMKWPEKIICVSNYEKELLLNDFKIQNSKLEVIPNGVSYLMPSKKKIKRDQLKLLYVGALRKYKGLDYILKSMHKLKSEYNIHIELDVIGKGEDKEYFRDIATDLSIMESIKWTDSISDIELHNKYIDADILLLLSDAEAYGLVVAEALAVGTPCIVSKKAALIEFQAEPGCYIISYPPNIEELSRLILYISKNNIKIGPFTDKIRIWKDISKDYERMYFKCLQGSE